MTEATVDPQKTDNPQDTGNGTPENQLPEKFKGKSAEDIAKSYQELEQKFSQATQETQLTKKQLADLKALEQFIDGDPESLAFLKQRIQGTKKQVPAQQTQQVDSRYDQLQQDLVDTKLATQATIFEKFEGKYGLNSEGVDGEIKKKIGETIKQMVAPKSPKAPTEIIANLPLDVLPMYLENAYKLVTADDQKEAVRRKALAQARMNSDASFSSTPSGSIRQNSQTLSPKEKDVAKKLGVSEEKYLAQKKAYASEYQEE